MGLFNSYGPCKGFTFFRLGQFRAEIWFIPRNYTIIEHRHPRENVELMFLFGHTEFFRRDIFTNAVESLVTTWKCFGRRFSVKSWHSHWFRTTNWPLVFINFQHFHHGYKPESAASDFSI